MFNIYIYIYISLGFANKDFMMGVFTSAPGTLVAENSDVNWTGSAAAAALKGHVRYGC